MRHTAFYMIGIPIGLVLSTLAALGMNRAIFGTKGISVAFRVIYYLPVISSVVAISLLFSSLFNLNGMMNKVLGLFTVKGKFLGLFGSVPVAWNQAPYNRISLIILMVWRGLGGSTLLLIAGLQGVSPTYYEAARLDGAGAGAAFFRITLPLLMPVYFFLIVTSIIGGAQLYVEPSLIYGDTNIQTKTVVQYIYYTRFGGDGSKQAGLASAAAMVLAVFVFIVTAIEFWINNLLGRDRV